MKMKYVYILTGIMIIGLVAITYFAPQLHIDHPERFAFLPGLNAFFNALSAVSLLIAIICIRKNQIKWHVVFVSTALFWTVIFLISYLFYHAITPPTSFGGEGTVKILYLFILFSHILLAAVTVPLILTALSYATRKEFDKHRKIARIAFPVWLYVSLTGVLIYIFNAPYYGS